jgi:hypothetical protein
MDAANPPTKRYSPFWPVTVVFISLIVLQSFYIAADFNDRSRIKQAHAELAPLVSQARKITQVLEDLGKELITLSRAHNAEAAKIVSELNLKLHEPASPKRP